MRRFLLALTPCMVLAHPNSLECNDPRFDPGNQAMYVDIVDNSFDNRLKFQANGNIDNQYSPVTYKHGDEVKINIDASIDDTYLRDDGGGGVLFGLRARPTLGYASDYGQFIEMSEDFVHQADGDGNCTNQIYTAQGFKGSSYAIWKAGERTYGDVELTLLWGNGPGQDDPYASSFPKLKNAYLMRRVITLKGPKMPDNPPFRRLEEAAEKCVHRGPNYNMPHAPVFVQNLRTFPEKSVTLPSGRCLACREDQKKRCRSALVVCPTTPGALAVEKLFKTPDCSAEPILVTRLTTRYAHCPGEEYHSPYKLDLERFVKKVLRDHPTYFKDEAAARAAIAEYRRMLYLIQKFPEAPVVPSKLVDLVWHEHILDTQQYKQDSQRMFGRYIHHAPAFGDNEDEAVKVEKESMLRDQAEMFKKYVQLFEDEPPTDVWPTARRLGGAGHLPDCCKAACVKPDCVSCVGCNAIDCGKFEATMLESPKKHALPEDFSGYVPIPRSIADNMLVVDQDYLCEVSPIDGMSLKWTISGDSIYMKQTLDTSKAGETWHSVGFTDVEPYNMGFGDYIVSLFDFNYSGVRDLHKFDPGNNYPCWDVLTQCSADGKSAGTQDLNDRMSDRQNGLSISSWNRKLNTGDAKDSAITPDKKKVMFAFGKDDHFTYHGHHQQKTCGINFFTMETDCGHPADTTTQYKCTVCAHAYDADADGNGVAFEDLPDSWLCPVCGQPKSAYKELPAETTYVCDVCQHVYDSSTDGNGADFEDLPDDWVCPVCSQPKSAYKSQASVLV